MGDVSAEPSMEDILASIKRIIAEDVESGTPARARRRAPAPPPVEEYLDEDDVLELSQPAPDIAPAPMPMSAPIAAAPAEPAPIAAAPAPAATAPAAVAAPAQNIISDSAAEASRAPLDTLSKLVVKPDVPGSDTLEGLVREMLKPMLSNWLDKNLPDLVESMVAKEIARITGQK